MYRIYKMIQRPANNCVLEFVENNDMKRKIKVFSTEVQGTFKVIKGLSAKNQVLDRQLMTEKGLKQLWIDSVVNGYECVKNEIFMRGIIDCLPEESLKQLSAPVPRFVENCDSISVEEFNKMEAEKIAATADLLYSA
jgi:hypothetical protein